MSPRAIALGAAAAALLLSVEASAGNRKREGMSWQILRRVMVEEQLRVRDITAPGVLKAMSEVPRHAFVPEAQRASAYEDRPLPIGSGQTISQPYIVAFMTQVLQLTGGERVLEIGTGSGYQAAVLSGLVKEVYSIEIEEALGRRAAAVLKKLGYANVKTRIGDGYAGWAEAAPFDAIIVTCAPERVPLPLQQQLATGGRMVIPVGAQHATQQLVLLRKSRDGALERENILPVRFVPMRGAAEKKQ